MRVNLKCPYEEKDKVKWLGAKWDPAMRTWYVTGIADLSPFKRWIPDFESVSRSLRDEPIRITLTRELIHRHATENGGWTRSQLQAIGVDWPPAQGWIDRVVGQEIDAASFQAFTAATPAKPDKAAKSKKRNTEPPIITTAPAIAWCGCTHVLPWEDCEHTLATQH